MAGDIRFVSLDFQDHELGIGEIPSLLHVAWYAGKWFSPPRDLGDGRFLDGRPNQAEVIEACRFAVEVAAEHRERVRARPDPLFPYDDNEEGFPAFSRDASDLLDALTDGAQPSGPFDLLEALRSIYFPKRPTGDAIASVGKGDDQRWSAQRLLSAMLLLLCDRAAVAFRTGNVLDLASYMSIAGELRAAIAMIFEAERHAHENRERAVRLNDERHRKNRDARQMVVTDWLADRTRFRSAESAAIHYIEFLQAKGFSIGNIRTVAGWIRDAARANGIKLR
jgi:hypothetical protein